MNELRDGPRLMLGRGSGLCIYSVPCIKGDPEVGSEMTDLTETTGASLNGVKKTTTFDTNRQNPKKYFTALLVPPVQQNQPPFQGKAGLIFSGGILLTLFEHS